MSDADSENIHANNTRLLSAHKHNENENVITS